MKNKKKDIKTLLSIVLAAAVCVWVAWLVSNKNGNTLKKELSDFAVSDTAQVNKIFLADKNGNETTLTREGAIWKVNGKYEARPDAVKILLETMAAVRVKAPVGRSMYNTVIRLMATAGTKVEIYQKGELYKVYYVGTASPDNLGNFMLLENSSAPFVTHIPGFSGYLYPRYYANPLLWRSTRLINLAPSEIASIQLDFTEHPEKSWLMTRKDREISLMSVQSGQKIEKVYTEKLQEYFSQFRECYAEAFVHEIEPWRKDSILSGKPREILTVQTVKGQKINLKTFNKVPVKPLYNESGEQLAYDPDRFYAMMNDQKADLILMQYFGSERFFREIDFFRPGPGGIVKN